MPGNAFLCSRPPPVTGCSPGSDGAKGLAAPTAGTAAPHRPIFLRPPAAYVRYKYREAAVPTMTASEGAPLS